MDRGALLPPPPIPTWVKEALLAPASLTGHLSITQPRAPLCPAGRTSRMQSCRLSMEWGMGIEEPRLPQAGLSCCVLGGSSKPLF